MLIRRRPYWAIFSLLDNLLIFRSLSTMNARIRVALVVVVLLCYFGTCYAGGGGGRTRTKGGGGGGGRDHPNTQGKRIPPNRALSMTGSLQHDVKISIIHPPAPTRPRPPTPTLGPRVLHQHLGLQAMAWFQLSPGLTVLLVVMPVWLRFQYVLRLL